MASSPVRIAAVAELTRSPLQPPARIVVEPPHSGCLRLHLSLTELPANAFTFTVDIVPSNSEVGDVRVSNP